MVPEVRKISETQREAHRLVRRTGTFTGSVKAKGRTGALTTRKG